MAIYPREDARTALPQLEKQLHGEINDLREELMSRLATDYIVEQGTDGNWTYRKWASGIAECWGVFTHSTTVANAWGNGYLSSSKTIAFPNNFFVATPIGLSLYADSTWVGMATCENTVTTKDSLKCFIFRTSSTGTSVADFYIHVEAKGRWK